MRKYISLKEHQHGDRSFLVSRANYLKSWEWRHINLTYLEKVAPKNLQLFLNLLRAFRTESVAYLEKIKVHYANGDFQAIEKTAHAMKPSGTYIGVDSLALLVSSLERSAGTPNPVGVEVLIKEIETLVYNVNEEIDRYLNAA